jgi:hypothetical protein
VNSIQPTIRTMIDPVFCFLSVWIDYDRRLFYTSNLAACLGGPDDLSGELGQNRLLI